MNQDIYQDKYRPTVPKIIDYGCIFITVFLWIFSAVLQFRFFWCVPVLLCIPSILSKFPGKICCNQDTVIIQDLYHGKKIIPIDTITDVTIKIYAHKEGIAGILSVHHYIFVMKIITEHKKYKFKMDAKSDVMEYSFGSIDIEKSKNKVAFLKLKKYIEAIHAINNL
ncbi:MAG: hypothetical protein K2G25_03890 [Oscillospiraceae bacterium]|nr:hypothetical protein [Oscillospiraceae bacterium]